MDAKKKRWIVISIVVVGIVIVSVCSWVGLKKSAKFDAQGYVRSVLNHNFLGETKGMLEITEGKTEKELQMQYENMVKDFVQKRILPGMELDEEMEMKYISLCKKMLSKMKYEVKEEKKLENGNYQVVVEYQVADILPKFHEMKAEEIAKIEKKVEVGEYTGTQEEIKKQIEDDVLIGFYQLLEKANQEVKYSEKQTMTFVIEKNEKGLYTMGTQLNEFLLKITGEDVKQD